MAINGEQSSRRLREMLQDVPVIPVLVIEDAGAAVPLAQALVSGGLPVVEVTLRTPAALEAIRAMSAVAGCVVGVGTLLSDEDVLAAVGAGASFGVSPGTTEPLVASCQANDLPLLGGVSTATEMMRMLDHGYDVAKFFPAEASGGTRALKALAGPFPDFHFCPTGGVNPDNLKSYLDLPNVLCAGGSWLAPADLVSAADWSAIESLAREADKLR